MTIDEVTDPDPGKGQLMAVKREEGTLRLKKAKIKAQQALQQVRAAQSAQSAQASV
jgi:hypothetical protein